MKDIIVFPIKKITGYDGKNSDARCYPLVSPIEACQKSFGTDAHFAPYSIPTLAEAEGECPRVNKQGLADLRDRNLEPHLNYVVIDVDLPDHRQWTDEDKVNFAQMYEATPLLHTAYLYSTLHGWRAIWPLARPIPARKADSYLDHLHDHLREDLGIPVDEACSDWNRLYRLPRVVRDGRPTAPDVFESDAEWANVEPLTWMPDADLVETTRPDKNPPAESTLGTERLLGAEIDHSWVRDAVYAIDPDIGYEQWIKIGMALVEEFGDEGFELWHEWSMDGEKYRDRHTMRRRADSFGGHPDPAKLATVLHIAEEHGFERPDPDEYVEFDDPDGGEDADRERYIAFTIRSRSYFVWDEVEGCWSADYREQSLLHAIDAHCPRTAGGSHTTDEGALRNIQRLLSDHGVPVREVQYVLGQDGNHYDPDEEAMLVGRAQIRPTLEPEYDPEIDEWIERLAGDRADELKDWLATVPRLQAPTCAIYIHGPHSIGKGMLAEGLAQLWNGTPTPYSELSSDFNALLAECPLIHADESMPTGAYSAEKSSDFRRLIGSTRRVVNAKFQPKAVVTGAPRLLITANNADALTIDENLTQEDIEAISRRVGYIKADASAREYLQKLGGRAHTEAWVDGGGIARHVLWLAEQRSVSPGGRYLVEGWKSELTQDMAVNTGVIGQMMIALVDYLLDSRQIDTMPYGDGEVWVHVPTLAQKWEDWTHDRDTPSQRDLTEALRSVATPGRTYVAGSQIRAWKVDPERIYRVAERYHKADRERLEAAIEAPSDPVIDGGGGEKSPKSAFDKIGQA